MTVLVLGIAMFLPLGLHITLLNLERLDLREDQWGALTVFMKADVEQDQASQLALELTQDDRVSGVEMISPEQGLTEFQNASGFGLSLELLDSNPLPWVLSITPGNSQDSDRGMIAEQLVSDIADNEAVESVDYDYKWLQRLGALLDLGRAAVSVLMLLFSVSVAVVVANTIRLDVAARTEEIEILALVGANPGFIRQPFLYSGFWYGLFGGIVAMVLTNGVLLYMDGPLQRLLHSYGEQQQLHGLGGLQTLTLLGIAGLLGLCGALVAVQRHLISLRVGGSLGRR